MNQALSNATSTALGYIPTSVKDAAGLVKQIQEEAQHITTLVLENVTWISDQSRLYLVLGYVDGFQIWDVQDQSGGRELVSARLDKVITHVKLLPKCEAAGSVNQAPMVLYVHKSAPREVHLFNCQTSKHPHLIRTMNPVLSIHVSRRVIGIALQNQAHLHDSRTFEHLFTVSTAICHLRPTFALGARWAAYKVANNEHTKSSAQMKQSLPVMDAVANPSVYLKDGISFIGALGQQALDSILMPPPDARATSMVAVRDVTTRQVVCQFTPHKDEPIEFMQWDSSGLLLISITQMGHTVLVHRAAAVQEDGEEEVNDGSSKMTFEHLFTLNRGYTPALISDINISEDSRMISVCSAKGTIHVYQLPIELKKRIFARSSEAGLSPPPSGSSPSSSSCILNTVTRIKLGSVWLQEGLLPRAAFDSSKGTTNVRTLCCATKAGTLSLFSLRLLQHEDGKTECFVNLNRTLKALRPRGSFVEKALDKSLTSTTPPTSSRAQTPTAEEMGPSSGRDDAASRRWLAEIELPELENTPIWFQPDMTFYALTSCQDNVPLRTGDIKQTRGLSTQLEFRKHQPRDVYVTNENDMQLLISEITYRPVENQQQEGDEDNEENFFLIDKPDERFCS